MAFAERKRRSWAREEKELREDCKGSSGRIRKGLESRAQRSGEGTRVTEDPRWSGGTVRVSGGNLTRVWRESGRERDRNESPEQVWSTHRSPQPRVPIPGAGSARGAAARQREN